MNYFRKFITLGMEGDRNSKAFGSAILEYRDIAGKINVAVQNLRGNTNFLVQLVNVDGNSTGVTVGRLTTDERGKGSLRTDINPLNVANSGLKLDDFQVVIIRIGDTKELITPLVGYVNNIIPWKNNFKTFAKNTEANIKKEVKELNNKVEDIKSTLIEKKDIITKTEEKSKPSDLFFTNILATKEKDIEKIKEESKEAKIEDKTEVNDFEKIEDVKEEIREEIKEETEAKEKTFIKDLFKQEEMDFADMVKRLQKEFEEIKHMTKVNIDDDNMMAKENIPAENELDIEPLEEVEDEAMEIESEETEEKIEPVKNEPMKKEYKITIDSIFTNNEKIKPFQEDESGITWILIGLEELALLPYDCYLFIKNPIFRTAQFMFGNLILGKYPDENKYIIGVPDFYNGLNSDYMRRNGFVKFMQTKDKKLEVGDLGYWIMVIK